LGGPCRPAVAAHVVVDDPEVLRELGRRGPEVEVAEPGAVDLHDRLALARELVPEVDAVDLREALHLASIARSLRRSPRGRAVPRADDLARGRAGDRARSRREPSADR